MSLGEHLVYGFLLLLVPTTVVLWLVSFGLVTFWLFRFLSRRQKPAPGHRRSFFPSILMGPFEVLLDEQFEESAIRARRNTLRSLALLGCAIFLTVIGLVIGDVVGLLR